METRDEEAGTRVIAWFPEDASPPREQPGWPVPSARLVGDHWVSETDWQSEYRRTSRPFAVGARFWIDPGEPERTIEAVPAGRTLLRIPARAAFGTGSHASTALVIELMEATPPAGLRVLDVGCGTGVLCFAALRLGAARAIGFDVEIEAAVAARENQQLNGVHGGQAAFFAGRVAAMAAAARFDLVLMNVLPADIEVDLTRVLEHVGARGSVILSGLLQDQVEWATRRLRGAGFATVGSIQDGEWAALRLARRDA